MQELQFARREEDALVVTNDAGEQFRIAIDEYLIAEMKQVTRPQRTGPRVKPREIQSLIRAGKTRAEVVALTGADESDVERHEGPVLAERQHILDSAHAVPVRAQIEPDDGEAQTFGGVITARLTGLEAERITWTAWRDATDGWMISLEFRSREVEHKAQWSFEHRKSLLAPLTSDAVTLSQQGDVGDRLIPKLRAVDAPERSERFDSGAFDPSTLQLDDTTADLTAAAQPATDAHSSSDAATDAAPQPDARDDAPEESAERAYSRRQEIEHRAISSHEEAPADLGQTADLLDALRRRRGERENSRPDASSTADPLPRLHKAPSLTPTVESTPAQAPQGPQLVTSSSLPDDGAPDTNKRGDAAQSDTERTSAATVTSIGTKPAPAKSAPSKPARSERVSLADRTASIGRTAEADTEASAEPTSTNKKRRASIPSWDDILFGTRSDEDPA